MESICDVCRKKGKDLSFCSKCKVVIYCSRECQKKAWPVHKLTCAPDQKEDIKKRVIKVLNTHESFIEMMSAICGVHWNKKELLCCHILKVSDVEDWTGIIKSYPAKSRDGVPKGCCGFAISCSADSPLKYENQSCAAVSKERCDEAKKIFGESIPKLPITIMISHDRTVLIKNQEIVCQNGVTIIDQCGCSWRF
jgi:hypothetical protein